jgi:hypothetical protein
MDMDMDTKMDTDLDKDIMDTYSHRQQTGPILTVFQRAVGTCDFVYFGSL